NLTEDEEPQVCPQLPIILRINKMYQIPVKNLTKLRGPRKRVKSILCDIGRQQCQDLLQTFQDADADSSFEDTEWEDFTDGHCGKKKRKHPYRSQTLCCSLCLYSSRTVPTFRTHIHRRHLKDLDAACLLMCPYCPFVSAPKVTEEHMEIFHKLQSRTYSTPQSLALAQRPKTMSVTISADACDDRYYCATCGYHDSLLYVMKKHVLVNHFATLLDRYFGLGSDKSTKAVGSKVGQGLPVKYHCKLCRLPAESIEHLLYHILSSEMHKDLQTQIMPCIIEKQMKQMVGLQNLLNLTPKAMPPVTLLARPNYVPQQTQQINGNSTVLMAAPRSTTALFCSPGHGQMFLSPQTQALLSGTSVSALQKASSGAPQVLPHTPVVKPINMVMPNMPNTVPVAMNLPRLPEPQQATQVLLPSGVQVNLQGDMGTQSPILVAQGLQLNQSGPRTPLLAPQSVRLIPTGNKVNGVPTYTLAPVQVTLPVPSTPSQLLVPQKQIGGPPSSVVPSSLMSAVQKAVNRSSLTPNQLAVIAPFLKKEDNQKVMCLRCKILLTEQGIFQHLLHGLKCLFCFKMFYSFKQILEHTKKFHSLKIMKNQVFIKEQFNLDCDEGGNLIFNTFNLNTDVPKDLLDNRELNLTLVTSSKEKIYIKMYPDKAEYSAMLKEVPNACPFCLVKLQNSVDYEHHLQKKHHIVPTIHAILKTPAYKCRYCFGVYNEKPSPKSISVHVQRCRCAPKSLKEVERKLNPDTRDSFASDLCSSVQMGSAPNGTWQEPIESDEPKKQVVTPKNRRRKTRGTKDESPALQAPVTLVLEPVGMERTSFEDRKDFLSQYFHRKPYLTKTETELLASRLWINKADVKAHFNSKLTKCLKAIQKKRVCVRLGFKMGDVNTVKHDLFFPEVKEVSEKTVVNEVKRCRVFSCVTNKKVNEQKQQVLHIPGAPVKKEDMNDRVPSPLIQQVTIKTEDCTEIECDLFAQEVSAKNEDGRGHLCDAFTQSVAVKTEDRVENMHDSFTQSVTVKNEDRSDIHFVQEIIVKQEEEVSEMEIDHFVPEVQTL
ncbi:hypothetical protein DNTS_021592, partial [Danionella cerebrum]